MRISKTAPENRAFFNEHGASLTKYNLIGLIGQTLSGLSLAYAVFALIVAQTAGKSPPTLSIALALVVGLFVELSNRVLARPAIKPYVVKDTFADDAELQHRHKVLNRSYLVGLIAIALLSYLLSAVGSTYYAEDSSEAPTLISTDSIKQASRQQAATIGRQFAQDSAMITSPYAMRLEAAQSRFKADSSATMKARTRYIGCANKGNVWCKNQLIAYLATIDGHRAALADSTGTISRQKSAALAELLQQRKSELRQLNGSAAVELASAKDSNQVAATDHDQETSFQGLIFIILTVAGQTVFYYMVYLTLQVEAGSEITYTLEPNEFWNLPSTAADFWTGISWRTERAARAALRKLYTPRKPRQTQLPYKGLFNNASNGNGATTQGQGNCKPKRKPSRTRTRTQAVNVTSTSRNGNEDEETQAQEQRKKRKGEVGSIEQCDHCGNDYERKTTRQRFCSTDCRLEHHASKHNGKRFDRMIKQRTTI